MAQYVFALLLELCHHVALHAEAVRAGEWTRQPDFSLRKTRLVELAGKTMGIVGYGRIGRRVGELARAFGMKVVVYDLFPPAASGEHVEVCALDELFARSDVISLHCPLTEQTAGLVNRPRLACVKPGGVRDQHRARAARRRGRPGRGAERGPPGRGRGGRGLEGADPAATIRC